MLIKLKEGTKPYTRYYYNLPKVYKVPAKKEIERMVKIGIICKLRWNVDTLWTTALFCQPKKSKGLCIVKDFCKMNDTIERHPLPLPRIIETLQQLGKFKSATALDLSKGFHSIPLDKELQKICMTVISVKKYV